MPEGPEIRRAADRIARAIVNRPVVEIFFAFDRLKPYAEKLVNQTPIAVQTKGKGMLIRFENDLSIYSHNQLYGKWEVRSAYTYPVTKRQLRLAIHTAKKSALLYSASDIDVLTDAEILTHPFLSRVGPDVLDATVTIDQVRARFADKRFQRRGLAALLLDQGFLCGLGNYLRSEVLFVAQVHPSLRPIDCAANSLDRLAQAALEVTQQSYRTGGITNDLTIAQELRAQGKRRREYRHWVFGRSGKPCHLCGTAIEKEILAGRRCYFCPNCQNPSLA